MSETVPEGPTGVADDSGQGASESAEDQEAQNLLDQMADEDPEKLRQQIASWKKLSRQHERAASKNSEAARKLAEIEEGQKSDLQKAEDARQAAERERDAAHAQTNRMYAAAAHDLPTELIEYLGDGTADEIGERAEQLSDIIKAEVDKRVEALAPQNGVRRQASPRQVSSMRPGAAPANTGPATPDQMFRRLVTGESD
jgi:ferric-dicitrate binding protein FerR (iron transport regulator)